MKLDNGNAFSGLQLCQEMLGGGSGAYSPRSAALVAGMLRGVAGDCVRVSFGWRAGRAAKRHAGCYDAKVRPARAARRGNRTRGILARAAEKLFAGSER